MSKDKGGKKDKKVKKPKKAVLKTQPAAEAQKDTAAKSAKA